MTRPARAVRRRRGHHRDDAPGDSRSVGAPSPSGGRVPLQIYQRGPDGAFMRIYCGDGSAFSAELGVYLVIATDQGAPDLRVARDQAGTNLVPTAEERVQLLDAEIAKLREASAGGQSPDTARGE